MVTHAMVLVGLLLCMQSCSAGGFGDAGSRLEKDLPAVISASATKANTSVSIAIDHPLFKVSLADGVVNYQTKRQAQPSDVYALGSITKTLTGAAVMKLAAEGELKLDDPAHLYVDPMFARERCSDRAPATTDSAFAGILFRRCNSCSPRAGGAAEEEAISTRAKSRFTIY